MIRLILPSSRGWLRALIEEARQRTRRRRRRIGAFSLLAVAVAGVSYLGVSHSGGRAQSTARGGHPEVVIKPLRHPRNGPLTLIQGQGVPSRSPGGFAGVDVVRMNGTGKTVWQCPNAVWCGTQVSIAWAPDGRHLLLTLDEIGGTSAYVGMHIVEIGSGRDIRVPSGAPPGPTISGATWPGYLAKMLREIGCFPATDLAWSPDGSSIAYRCGPDADNTPHINVLKLDGTNYKALPTGTAAFWPSWSPSSTRIAYSSALKPIARSAIFSVSLNGSDRRLLAHGGAAPAWSPNGRVIAYESACGIRLVTPTGRDITPRRGSSTCGIGRSGPPVWSPDGKKLAFETSAGNWVMDANGSHLRLVVTETSVAHYGEQPGRAAWRPLPTA